MKWYDFNRTEWVEGGARYEVEREDGPDSWRVREIRGYKWRVFYMTPRELFKKFYDFDRKDVVPEELQLEFDEEGD